MGGSRSPRAGIRTHPLGGMPSTHALTSPEATTVSTRHAAPLLATLVALQARAPNTTPVTRKGHGDRLAFLPHERDEVMLAFMLFLTAADTEASQVSATGTSVGLDAWLQQQFSGDPAWQTRIE